METLELALDRAELLKGLPPAFLQTMAACATSECYEAGDYVCRSGEEADAFWLLREGRLALEILVPGRGEVTIATIAAGDIVGFSWLCPPHLMHFDVIAVTHVEATRFDGRRLRERCNADPRLGFELTSRFAQLAAERVEAMNIQLLDLYGDHPIEHG
jgi:CRP-like cAMP-binding protein